MIRVTGLLRYLDARSRIAVGHVALNIRLCLGLVRELQIYLIWGLNPMSNIMSASSSTK